MAVTKPVAFDHVQVRVYCYANDQIAVNVLDFVVDEPVITGGATLQEMANVLAARFAGSYKAWMPPTAGYRGVSVQDLSNPVSVPYYSTSGNGVGTSGVSLAPSQVSGLIRKRTLSGGRANRGRIYVPFPSLTAITTAGILTAPAKILLGNIRTIIGITQNVVGAGGTTNMSHVIWHRGGTADYSLVAALEEQDWFATQRRRGAYGRTNVMPF